MVYCRAVDLCTCDIALVMFLVLGLMLDTPNSFALHGPARNGKYCRPLRSHNASTSDNCRNSARLILLTCPSKSYMKFNSTVQLPFGAAQVQFDMRGHAWTWYDVMMSFQPIKVSTRLNSGRVLAHASLRVDQLWIDFSECYSVSYCSTAQDSRFQEMSSSQRPEFPPVPFSSTYPEQNFKLLELPAELACVLEEQRRSGNGAR